MNSLKQTIPLIQTGSIHQTNFEPSPIQESWIIEGNPVARVIRLARSNNDAFSCWIWECPQGKFKYVFPVDEMTQILEGEVLIQEEGAEYTLRAGDTAYFPQGLVTYWTISKYVKKLAVLRAVPQPLLRRIISKIKRIKKGTDT
jgi:uncharacterized cupin superfamily protein